MAADQPNILSVKADPKTVVNFVHHFQQASTAVQLFSPFTGLIPKSAKAINERYDASREEEDFTGWEVRNLYNTKPDPVTWQFEFPKYVTGVKKDNKRVEVITEWVKGVEKADKDQLAELFPAAKISERITDIQDTDMPDAPPLRDEHEARPDSPTGGTEPKRPDETGEHYRKRVINAFVDALDQAVNDIYADMGVTRYPVDEPGPSGSGDGDGPSTAVNDNGSTGAAVELTPSHAVEEVARPHTGATNDDDEDELIAANVAYVAKHRKLLRKIMGPDAPGGILTEPDLSERRALTACDKRIFVLLRLLYPDVHLAMDSVLTYAVRNPVMNRRTGECGYGPGRQYVAVLALSASFCDGIHWAGLADLPPLLWGGPQRATRGNALEAFHDALLARLHGLCSQCARHLPLPTAPVVVSLPGSEASSEAGGEKAKGKGKGKEKEKAEITTPAESEDGDDRSHIASKKDPKGKGKAKAEEAPEQEIDVPDEKAYEMEGLEARLISLGFPRDEIRDATRELRQLARDKKKNPPPMSPSEKFLKQPVSDKLAAKWKKEGEELRKKAEAEGKPFHEGITVRGKPWPPPEGVSTFPSMRIGSLGRFEGNFRGGDGEEGSGT